MPILDRLFRHRVGHAYLFAGPAGAGQRQVAFQAAMALLCFHRDGGRPCGRCTGCQQARDGVHPDLLVPDQYGIDAARHVISTLALRPQVGQRKVVLWYDVDRLTPQAANALLKSMEEPPTFAVFICTTEHLEGVLPTLRSRCQVMILQARPRLQVARELAAHLTVSTATAYWALLSCDDDPQAATARARAAETTDEAQRLSALAETLRTGDLLDALLVARQLVQWGDRLVAAAEVIVMFLRGELTDHWGSPGETQGPAQPMAVSCHATAGARLRWTRALAQLRRAVEAHANVQVAAEVFCWQCWQAIQEQRSGRRRSRDARR